MLRVEEWNVMKCFEKSFECFYEEFSKKGVISISDRDTGRDSESLERIDSRPKPHRRRVMQDSHFEDENNQTDTYDPITPKKVHMSGKRNENEQKTLRKSSSSKISLFDTNENQKGNDFNTFELEAEVAEFDMVDSKPNKPKLVKYPTEEVIYKEEEQIYKEEEELIIQDIRSYENLGTFEEILHHVTSSEGQDEPPCFLFQPNTNEMTEDRCLLPPMSSKREYTLVLDLDETLVHFVENQNGSSQFLIRPYAQYFLKKMSNYYEIIVFTAAMQDYADYILDRMDTTNCISHRLYRKHTNLQNNVYHKDLSRIGRNLSRTIIVDNNAENFQLQPDNGIYIKSWYDDPKDTALKRLCPLLTGKFFFNFFLDIVDKGYDDVRVALKIFREKMIRNYRKFGGANEVGMSLEQPFGDGGSQQKKV